jgi:hypothetical protein
MFQTLQIESQSERQGLTDLYAQGTAWRVPRFLSTLGRNHALCPELLPDTFAIPLVVELASASTKSVGVS